MTRYAMLIDLSRCVGCQACVVACKMENEVPEGDFRLRMREIVTGTFPDLRGEFRLESCYHCSNPPCVPVCPTGATFQTDEGLVLIDPVKCSGCKVCVTACPYDMRHVDARGGYVDKCTFCDHRLAQGQQPACVETCPTGARVFGDMDDPNDPIHSVLSAADLV